MSLVIINTDGQVVEQKHITFFTRVEKGAYGDTVTIYEVVENYYVHPDTRENYEKGLPYTLTQQVEIVERGPALQYGPLFSAGVLNEHSINVIRGLLKRNEEQKR